MHGLIQCGGGVSILLISHACRANICSEYIPRFSITVLFPPTNMSSHLWAGFMTLSKKILNRKRPLHTLQNPLNHYNLPPYSIVFVVWRPLKAAQQLWDVEEEKCQWKLGQASMMGKSEKKITDNTKKLLKCIFQNV